MMPIYSGIEVLEEIRKYSDTPILMLTALSDEKYELYGLNNGADDYISKPFSYPILMARINSLLKRVINNHDTFIVEGALMINLKSHEVIIHSQPGPMSIL